MTGDLITGDARLVREDAASDHWFTPLGLFFKLAEEFGPFTLDPSGHARSPVSQKIGRFFTIADSGLSKSWAGHRIFLNNPYSDNETWVERAHHEAASLNRSTCADIIVQLLPAWTDRGWWADWVEPFRDRPNGLVTTRFLRRQTFGTPADPYAKASKSTASFSSVVLIWKHPFQKEQTR